VDLRRYWRLAYQPKLALTRAEAVDESRRLLLEAVAIRLRSDVPVGIFLSGGIDSGLVTAAAAQQSATPVRTFSVGFSHQGYNELPLASLVATRYGTVHTELVLDVNQAATRMDELLPRLIEAYDQPFADSSAIPSYLISAEASKHVKVILNGDGGDEVFAGYRRHTATLIASSLSWARPLLRLAARLSPRPRQRRGVRGFAYRLLDGAWRESAHQYLEWTALLCDQELSDLLCGDVKPSVEESLWDLVRARMGECDDRGVTNQVDRVLWLDSTHILADDLLVKMDIATMANSLEGRSPLLDHKLVEFAAALPHDMKCSVWTTKPILRQIARSWLPGEVARAPKRGFEVPMADWLRGQMKPFAAELLLSPKARFREFVDHQQVDRMFREHQAGTRDRAWQLWALIYLEGWLARQHQALRA
jgi:asparagine synthase (glutamine-hydrolysing)